jgi:beta-glucosidase
MGECAWMSGEAASRTDLSMPAPQRRLLEQLATLGKPIVLLNFAGRATVLTWEHQHLPAIMNVWFGSECANAVADVLFGDAEPGGRLTVSMPKATGQVPLYYNQLNTGRHIADDYPEYVIFNSNYLDVTNGPLYPFGYGLGYTTFDVSPIRYDGTKASVTVTNIGSREGSTVVQLYIHDIAASVSRPIRELKGFQRITLQPGKSQEVTFHITKDMLSFYGSDLRYTFEPGDFDLYIGFDCHTENKTRITVME